MTNETVGPVWGHDSHEVCASLCGVFVLFLHSSNCFFELPYFLIFTGCIIANGCSQLAFKLLYLAQELLYPAWCAKAGICGSNQSLKLFWRDMVRQLGMDKVRLGLKQPEIAILRKVYYTHAKIYCLLPVAHCLLPIAYGIFHAALCVQCGACDQCRQYTQCTQCIQPVLYTLHEVYTIHTMCAMCTMYALHEICGMCTRCTMYTNNTMFTM